MCICICNLGSFKIFCWFRIVDIRVDVWLVLSRASKWSLDLIIGGGMDRVFR